MALPRRAAEPCSSLLSSFSHLRITPQRSYTLPRTYQPRVRTFATTSTRRNWLAPQVMEKRKSMVGRPRMPTGGSMRGTEVVWGEWGLRMKDHDRRISAKQLKLGEDTIRTKLRGMHYKLYMRVSANIGVYTKGNEVRMGKGKGKFDYWAARVAVSRIIFELKGNMHEQVAMEAFRLAGNKMPGQYEFVRRGDPAVVGVTKLKDGITLQSLKEARRPKQSEDDPQMAAVIPPTMTVGEPTSISPTSSVPS